MTGIPAEAIQAAAEAYHDAVCPGAICTTVIGESHLKPARAALEAAAPFLATAERERIRQLMHDHGSHIRPCGACRRQGWAWVPLPHLIGDPDGSTHP